MKIEKLILVAMAGALGLAVQARASVVFDLEYSDTAGDVASGLITANLISPGEYLAVSGTVDVTAGAAFGSYTLVANPYTPPSVFPYYVNNEGGPGYANDILYYPYTPANTYVDFDGLLGFESSAGNYLNIYSDTPLSYGFWAGDDANSPLVNVDGVTTSSLTLVSSAVPEPTTIIASMLLLLPFGASMLRILRKSRTA
jgi:hypothetical protein